MAAPFDLDALAERLRRHVETLAGTPRVPGTPEHRAAAAYIYHHLRQAGFSVHEARLRADITGTNVLTEPLPHCSDLPLVVIGAHYDTAPDTPGADDNASAVAALLELAGWIYPHLQSAGPFAGRLQLAAYDLEEYGFLGSEDHCRTLRQAGISLRGMISLEMLGYTAATQQLPEHLAGLYPAVGDFIGICGNEASRELLEAVTAAMKTVPGLPVEFIAVPGRGEALPEVRLSDHRSFWDRGYPALMITDTSFFRNPHYHQATDTPETLDYSFLAKVTAGVCAAAQHLILV